MRGKLEETEGIIAGCQQKVRRTHARPLHPAKEAYQEMPCLTCLGCWASCRAVLCRQIAEYQMKLAHYRAEALDMNMKISQMVRMTASSSVCHGTRPISPSHSQDRDLSDVPILACVDGPCSLSVNGALVVLMATWRLHDYPPGMTYDCSCSTVCRKRS